MGGGGSDRKGGVQVVIFGVRGEAFVKHKIRHH